MSAVSEQIKKELASLVKEGIEILYKEYEERKEQKKGRRDTAVEKESSDKSLHKL